MARKPTLFMIVGPNGAGKTTLFNEMIGPAANVPFINADIIQKTEMNDPSVEASYKAAGIARGRVADFIAAKASFAHETVFSHESHFKKIESAQANGYNVVLYHVDVANADLSVARVGQRVEKGGHPVPEQKIRDRYERNKPLIVRAAKMADRAFVYDNSVRGRRPKLGIEFSKGAVVNVGTDLPLWQRQHYKAELRDIAPSRLNPLAASFAQAKRMAEEIEGRPTYVVLPKAGQSFQGNAIRMTDRHVLQRTFSYEYVAHITDRLSAKPVINKPFEVSYSTSKIAQVRALDDTQDWWLKPSPVNVSQNDYVAQALQTSPPLLAAKSAIAANAEKLFVDPNAATRTIFSLIDNPLTTQDEVDWLTSRLPSLAALKNPTTKQVLTGASGRMKREQASALVELKTDINRAATKARERITESMRDYAIYQNRGKIGVQALLQSEAQTLLDFASGKSVPDPDAAVKIAATLMEQIEGRFGSFEAFMGKAPLTFGDDPKRLEVAAAYAEVFKAANAVNDQRITQKWTLQRGQNKGLSL